VEDICSAASADKDVGEESDKRSDKDVEEVRLFQHLGRQLLTLRRYATSFPIDDASA